MLDRSIARSVSLALVGALALGGTSCLGSHPAHSQHVLEVKADADADFSHAQAEALHAQAHEPEFFEGAAAPEAPAAFPEDRPSAPSAAHVWVAGQHTRRDGEWVWVRGHYALPPSADVVWVPGHWVAHLDGYAWIDGGWR